MALSCCRSLARLASIAVALVAIPFAAGAQTQGQALLGVYYGNQGWDMAQVARWRPGSRSAMRW
jgi:hypothetical protein